MNTKLKAYFPMIRTREEILRDIQQNINLTERFYSWKEEQREEFMDFCTGVKGVKMLYDAFFKEIMNPETVPERLEDFLEVLLQRKVKIIEVLPGDSTRLADEQSLLIMDILVRFDDGSYCNVEVQKIGYAFPGERCACYSSDLLLRQYKNARSTRKEKFSYKDIKSVYTIVLIDKSTGDFHKYKDRYCHIFQQRSDTGLELNLLQKYVFLPLDIFRENMHNKGITDKVIFVRHTMQRLKNLNPASEERTRIITGVPKSGRSVRMIPMNQDIEKLCNKWRADDLEAYVLTGKAGYFLEPRTLQYRMRQYTKDCDLKNVHFHTLRHSFATRCVEAGFEIRSLSEILGHSSTRITLECYVHSSMNLKRKNMEKLKIADTVEKEFPGA